MLVSIILPTYNRSNLFFERGQGSWLETKEGDLYLDFGAGIAVNSLGHCHPKLINALIKQSRTLWHVSNLYIIKKLTNHIIITPIESPFIPSIKLNEFIKVNKHRIVKKIEKKLV